MVESNIFTNILSDGASFISSGREFHNLAPVKAKLEL
jgi:isocitrate/isopropylmalate dehydrogenase